MKILYNDGHVAECPQEEELATKSARLAELDAMLNMDKRENETVDGEIDEDQPEQTKRREEPER